MNLCTRKIVITIFESLGFLFLCSISVYMSLEVWREFILEYSSFNQYEVPIEKYPTITVCMPVLRKSYIKRGNFKYGIDYNITYNDVFINIGKTEIVNPDTTNEEVHLEIIPSSISGLCARINPLLKYIMENGVKTLKLDFNESISYNDLPSLEFYITSDKNSDGIFISEWMQGDELAIKIEKVSYF